MEFHTDGGRIHPITCGRGSPGAKDPQPDELHAEHPGKARLLSQVPTLKHARVLNQLPAPSDKQGEPEQQQQQPQHMRFGSSLFEEDAWYNEDRREASDVQAYPMGSLDSTAGVADLEGSSAGQADSSAGPAMDSEAAGDQEWCESLTQGQVPAGTYEISDAGPRSVINTSLAQSMCGLKILAPGRVDSVL
jgi:hypothetical protein